MLNRTTSRKFIAPRRQERKEKNYFSELGVLCVFARGIFFPFRKPISSDNFKYVWLGF